MIAFLAGVWVARQLGPAMYGVIGFASAIVLYFTHLAGCGIDLPGVRDVARDRERVAALGADLLTARLLISLALCAILAAGALLFLGGLEGLVLALYALTLLSVGPSPRWILIGLSRPRPVALARTVGEALYLGLVLLLVRQAGDVALVPWAQFLGDVLATAILLVALARGGMRFRLRVDWAKVRPILARAFPLVINVVVGLMIFNSDLIFLWIFRDRESVGQYGAAYQLISFLTNVATAFAFSLLPVLSAAAAEDGERDRLYRTSQAQVFALGLPIAVGGALVAPRIIALVFGADYAPAALPLAVLLASVPFLLYRDVGSMALIVSGREPAVMRITALTLAVNVGLNLIFIPRYGLPAAAGSTLFAEIVRAWLTARVLRFERWPGLEPGRMWKAVAAAAAMTGVLALAPGWPVYAAIGGGAAVYAAVLAATGAIEIRRGAWPALRV